MSTQEIQTLLLLAVVALVVMSLYTIWLRLKLWLIHQTVNEFKTLLSGSDYRGPQTEEGCLSLFVLLLLTVAVVLLTLSLS